MLNQVRNRSLAHRTQISYWIRRCFGLVPVATIILLLQHQVLAEATVPVLDERCESREERRVINLPIRSTCWDKANACIEARMSATGETNDQAQEFCWKRSLKMDQRFVGPCPSYLEELESADFAGEEWLLPRINLRKRFTQLNDLGHPTHETYKHEESIQNLRRLLAKDPHNAIALTYLKSLLREEDTVEKLTLEIKLHELDPDCPNNRWLRKISIDHKVDELADSWLTGSGPGSELSKSERKELVQRTRNMLLDMYDIAVAQDSGTARLYWALESVHDTVLSGQSENLEQLASDLDLDLEGYADRRTTTLVRTLSNEYDVESVHGRSQSLRMMCNDYAFELGLAEHCLLLLGQFSQQSVKSREEVAIDWAQAAVLLVNWMTRDCSPHAWVLVGPAPLWWDNRRCANEDSNESIQHIGSLVARVWTARSRAEHELLEAYLRMDEKSAEHFRKALVMDSSITPYGVRLSKRLLKRGHIDAVSDILSSIDAGRENDLNVAEKYLLDRTLESVRDGSYSNWREAHRDVF